MVAFNLLHLLFCQATSSRHLRKGTLSPSSPTQWMHVWCPPCPFASLLPLSLSGGGGVQDELLNIIYWWRQVAGVLLGLVIGFMGITGFMGFSM